MRQFSCVFQIGTVGKFSKIFDILRKQWLLKANNRNAI